MGFYAGSACKMQPADDLESVDLSCKKTDDVGAGRHDVTPLTE